MQNNSSIIKDNSKFNINNIAFKLLVKDFLDSNILVKVSYLQSIMYTELEKASNYQDLFSVI